MLKAYKYRMYPNNEQKIYLAKTFGCTRFVYNKMLEYKAQWYGREIIVAPSNYASSQLCSNCGNKSSQTKDLGCRTYICPVCGMVMDRDINASKNLLKLAM